MKKETKKDNSEIYQQFSQIEHVLKRPDTYLGSINNVTEECWVLSDELDSPSFVKKEVTYNKGLEHCIIELITNAVDHSQRIIDSKDPVTKIDVTCKDSLFTIKNNGEGIPIEIHKKTNLYIPEMIFANLLTSSNYDDSEKRTWGGKNGIGAKAANVFASKFTIEIVSNNQKYVQTFSNNLSKIEVPVISKVKSKDYTMIYYEPDFKRFGISSFNDSDNLKIIEKNVYDASATTNKKVSVFFNDVKIPVKEFKDYTNLYSDLKKVHFSVDRWDISFSNNPFDDATHISFVNGIFTKDNGTHVDYILDQISKKLIEKFEESAKIKREGIKLKPQFIKDNIMTFTNCLIDNPQFNSQTKNKLESKPSTFGSTCVIPQDIIDKISKLGFIDNVINLARAKEMKNLEDTTKKKNTKKTRLIDIPKLNDADNAGSKNREEALKCTLIITEGDSGQSLANAGFTVVGRAYWGSWPLKGKFLNVRGATVSQLINNTELNNLNRILGLFKKDGIEDHSKLRYGRLMILADQDTDGFHIKGLIMNFMSIYWPKLLEKGFVVSLLTPIVKLYKGETLISSFYNLDDYKKFIKNDKTNYRVKYFKGLGTSKPKDAVEYFKDVEKNVIKYTYERTPSNDSNDVISDVVSESSSKSSTKGSLKKFKMNMINESLLTEDDRTLQLAFDKDKSDNRKEWIIDSIKNKDNLVVDYKIKTIPVKDFINKELIQFSIYDNERSIPNIIDGFKVSQRKVVYGSFLKKIFKESDEMKVALLGSYVSQHTDYHHGEASLQSTIINMAQDFVGSNNANLLVPSGSFGSRDKGGDDAASPRYIFTYFKGWVPLMFRKEDEAILNYSYNEGQRLEPIFYVPILPMILVNGSMGIGTGWSSSIPCFRPSALIENIKGLLRDEPVRRMIPWYRGFTGTIKEVIKDSRWITSGVYTRNGKDVHITELPIGLWTSDFIEKVLNNPKLVSSYRFEEKVSKNSKKKKESESDKFNKIEFFVELEDEDLSDEDLVKEFKLETSINATNMVAFDHNGHIHKYNNIMEIITEFYDYRLSIYKKRKENMLKELSDEIDLISEKIRFIKMVNNDEIIVSKRSKDELIQDLVLNKFKKIEENYNYLLDLKIHFFTTDKIKFFEKDLVDVQLNYKKLNVLSEKELWLSDLEELSSFVEFQ